jgi:hypothetical protein
MSIRCDWGSGIGGDMVVEGVALQHQLDEVAPSDRVIREVVEDYGDWGSDVINADGLGVEVGDGGDLVRVIGVREEGRVKGSREVLLGGCEVGGHTRAAFCSR